MREKIINVTNTALQDIRNVHAYIVYELLQPATADKYIQGIYEAVKHLAFYGASIAVSEREFLLSKYGSMVRTINYEKMAIIYTIEDDTIIIQRIMAASLIL